MTKFHGMFPGGARPRRAGTKKGVRRMTDPLQGGGYLLSRFRSTIGVTRFNFSVRNGKRWSPRAVFALMSFQGTDPAGNNEYLSELTRNVPRAISGCFFLFTGTFGQLVPLG